MEGGFEYENVLTKTRHLSTEMLHFEHFGVCLFVLFFNLQTFGLQYSTAYNDGRNKVSLSGLFYNIPLVKSFHHPTPATLQGSRVAGIIKCHQLSEAEERKLENHLFIPGCFTNPGLSKGARLGRTHAHCVSPASASTEITRKFQPGPPKVSRSSGLCLHTPTFSRRHFTAMPGRPARTRAQHLSPAPTARRWRQPPRQRASFSCSPLKEAARAHTPPRTRARGTRTHARTEPPRPGSVAGREGTALGVSARRRPAHIAVRLGLGLGSGPGGR